MEKDEITWVDPEAFTSSGNDKLDYKFILMRQIDKVRVARSTEMRGGYNEQRPTGGGGMISIYIADTREIYINSVKMFNFLMIPDQDQEFNKKKEELSEKLDETLKPLKEQYETDKTKDKEGKYQNTYRNDVSVLKVQYYDDLFEQLILLCQRTGKIGGAKNIEDSF